MKYFIKFYLNCFIEYMKIWLSSICFVMIEILFECQYQNTLTTMFIFSKNAAMNADTSLAYIISSAPKPFA